MRRFGKAGGQSPDVGGLENISGHSQDMKGFGDLDPDENHGYLGSGDFCNCCILCCMIGPFPGAFSS